VKLLIAVADAQSQAVRGTSPDPQVLAKAVGAVDRSGLPADTSPGAGSGTTAIRPRILALTDTPTFGGDAYLAYGQVTDLLLQQIVGIDTTFGLAVDPESDVSRLVDALTVRLPAMTVEAGRFEDEVVLAGQAGAAGDPRTAVGAVRIAIPRDRLVVDAHAFSAELSTVFRSTASATLGPHLLGDVDLVTTDVAALAPSAGVADGTAAVPSAQTVADQRRAFDPAVSVLATAGLTELDRLLAARQDGGERQRRDLLALLGGGLAVAAVSGWWLRRQAVATRAMLADPRPPRSGTTARVGRRPGARTRPGAARVGPDVSPLPEADRSAR
jgi:hypothetical protein